MPRKRKTQPGQGGAYTNRTDLVQPATTPTGLPYGQNQALEQAQQTQPLPQQADPFSVALQAAKQFTPTSVPLNAPSNRPNEPVTAGLASGAGPGPEALGQNRNLSSLLARLQADTQSPIVEAMLDRARRMGL